MKKYAIFGVMLLMVYGVVMAVMWSKYEPRDEYIEFKSDFRDGIVELVPGMTFSQLSPEIFHASESILMTVDIPNPERFLALESYRPNSRGETPSITVSVEIEKNARSNNLGILVNYESLLYFTNAMEDNTYIDAILLRHTDRYDWPGQSNNWTATSLSYTGGDFHFDNKGNLWFLTWIIATFTLVMWIFTLVIPRYPQGTSGN